MIEYSADRKTAVYCGYKFRRDPKTGYYLSSKKTDIGKRERLHCFVWRMNYGDIPKGYNIHHKDHDKSNNEIDNLELLSVSEHRKRHYDEMSDEQRKKRAQILKEKALPKAVLWHKSEEGKQWHKDKYINDAPKLHKTKNFVCLFCGKKYMAEITGNNKYCSNNCKSRARRKSGVDNEERICCKCGLLFSANKYTSVSKCRICRDKKH